MNRLVALSLLLLAPLPIAHAQQPNQRGEAEAKSFLKPCHQSNPERQDLCRSNQRNFIEQYIEAKAGDLMAMGSTASSFSRPGNAEEVLSHLGVPVDMVQSCAWRILRAARSHSSTDEYMALHVCNALPPRQHSAAYIRAGHLAHQLNTAPATVPPMDAPLPKGLTTTAVPLQPN